MTQVTVIGSRRASTGVAATVRRVCDALASAGVTASPTGALDGQPLLVVDPAAWYAEQATPPANALLARATALSVAPYGTPAMQDDGQVGRFFAAIGHPEARAAEHLTRLGCRASTVPLGCRPAALAGRDRALDLVTYGPPTPRRLRVIAGGAPALEDVACAHRFHDDLAPADGSLLADARVFLDIAADDDAAPDVALLLEVIEAGAAVATERLGEFPAAVDGALVRAPRETLFVHARELAGDRDRSAALAAGAHAALAEALPLAAMGNALAELVSEATTRVAPDADEAPPQLSHHAAPPARLTLRQIIEREQRKPDAAIREGLRSALSEMRDVKRRLERVETGLPDATEVLSAPDGPADVRVSVIVPCFRARALVAHALESARRAATADDAPRLEVVVVDDGSPQDDAAVAIDWARAHPELPVTVVRHRYNRNLPSARNTALEHARGELVLPLDADNELLPSGLPHLVAALDADPQAAFAYGLLQEFDTSGPAGLRGLYPWDADRLRYGNYIDALALIRADALRALGGFAADMSDGYEDWDLWCRVAEAGGSGAWVPRLVGRYRLRADSMSVGLHLSHVGPLADMLARHPALLG